MNHFSRFVAKRYLFRKGRVRAVHIVSTISAITIAVIVMSAIVILSVFNGYEQLLLKGSAKFDPPFLLTRSDKQPFIYDEVSKGLREYKDLNVTTSPIIYGEGMACIGNHFEAIQLIGIDSNYLSICPVKTTTQLGQFIANNNNTTLGGEAYLALGSPFEREIKILVPSRTKKINPLAPQNSIHTINLKVKGVYISNSEQYNSSLFLSTDNLRYLLELAPNTCMAIGIQLNKPSTYKGEKYLSAFVDKLNKTQATNSYKLLSQIEQQPGITNLVSIEKWLAYCILVFIMFLAAFNVVCSTSLLILEKKKDLRLFSAIGASLTKQRVVFFTHSLSVTMIGIASGLVLALLLCLIQHSTGFATFPVGTSIESYPVSVAFGDIIAVITMMLLLGTLATWIPVKILIKAQ